ncbi:MAG: molybdenum cofactor biosynthesis protein MoaE [Spirochaetales bacterium]|nr:molybdenum cofactor biosynthesis protein MoaE [Spirochaetales bacterium]
MAVIFELADYPINDAALRFGAPEPEAGAVVCFEGRVRNHHDGKKVVSLCYSVYPELAFNEGNAIAEEARERFGLIEVFVVHRYGELVIGDLALWVRVTAVHRGEAFDACRYIIDEIKQRLPVWKDERYVDGSRAWVYSQDHNAGGSV